MSAQGRAIRVTLAADAEPLAAVARDSLFLIALSAASPVRALETTSMSRGPDGFRVALVLEGGAEIAKSADVACRVPEVADEIAPIV